MKGVKNYTFTAKDTTTGAPSVDGGDYSIESTTSTPSVKAQNRNVRKVANYKNNTGTVGRVGYVTENAILYEDTGKYNYAMDENLYYIEYSGLKQKKENKYDEFSFNLQSHNLDKNNRITDWEDLMAKMNTVLSAKGYTRSPANCMNTLNTKYETFVNGNIMIVFDNIGYKTIYVSCYVTGNWTLNR